MISIISGTPGSGKTALLVEMMMEELKKGRKIFTYGIPKLLLPVHEAGDVHTWQDGTWLQIDRYDPVMTKARGINSTWFPRGCPVGCEFLSTCPRVGALNPIYTPDAGALLIIDESHTEFPQRASGKAPPPYVEALTVHRHQGLDIWFVSQRPSFLDPFVRGLSSRHIHLSLNPFSFTGSRNKYEWSEYQETVNRASKMLASKSDYKPSPAVFPLYQSASIHTKLDQRMPTIMKVFIFMICIVCFMAFLAVSRVQSHIKDIKKSEISTAESMPKKIASSKSLEVAADAGGAHSDTAAAVGTFVPIPPPVVAAAPQISSCISSETRCQCYSDKGIRVEMSEADCRLNVRYTTEKYKRDDYQKPDFLATR